MRKNIIFIIFMAFITAGCATIIHGTKQPIGISSNPSQALVTVDGKELGKTPITEELKRKDHHVVRITLDGYEPYETNLTRKTSGWIAGNIIFGGIIGLAVDAITGGLYKLTPEQVQADLIDKNAEIFHQDDLLYISVVLEPKEGWEKVGQLQQ